MWFPASIVPCLNVHEMHGRTWLPIASELLILTESFTDGGKLRVWRTLPLSSPTSVCTSHYQSLHFPGVGTQKNCFSPRWVTSDGPASVSSFQQHCSILHKKCKNGLQSWRTAKFWEFTPVPLKCNLYDVTLYSSSLKIWSQLSPSHLASCRKTK